MSLRTHRRGLRTTSLTSSQPGHSETAGGRETEALKSGRMDIGRTASSLGHKRFKI